MGRSGATLSKLISVPFRKACVCGGGGGGRGESGGGGWLFSEKINSFSDEANSFLIDKIPVQKGIGVRESKQKVTKIVSLVQNLGKSTKCIKFTFLCPTVHIEKLEKKSNSNA